VQGGPSLLSNLKSRSGRRPGSQTAPLTHLERPSSRFVKLAHDLSGFCWRPLAIIGKDAGTTVDIHDPKASYPCVLLNSKEKRGIGSCHLHAPSPFRCESTQFCFQRPTSQLELWDRDWLSTCQPPPPCGFGSRLTFQEEWNVKLAGAFSNQGFAFAFHVRKLAQVKGRLQQLLEKRGRRLGLQWRQIERIPTRQQRHFAA
jgi:hypothetical protein